MEPLKSDQKLTRRLDILRFRRDNPVLTEGVGHNREGVIYGKV